ncbi:ribonuclease Z [Acidianus brierleyi]|uniref:Ribonuclease Z n=1 Tax=Acidianus brierleyi TaxID=41673 RepID=A0A2U9IG95_9CREN|nr:ribonuclease Z [Acidianus brierleyi]AWR95082.1 ribonuclease Z [Acidianus brierleyi]
MIEIYFLGTGGGAPSKRKLPAYLIRRNGFSALFDCGEGTQITMIDHGISIMSIKLIAITHLHADHVMGVPSIIQTMAMYSRTDKLYIMGPRKIQEFLKASFEGTYFCPSFPIEFIDQYEDNEITIRPFKTKHVIPSQGYIFQEKEKVNIDKERIQRDGIKDWRIIKDLKSGKEVKIGNRILRPEDYLIKKEGYKISYTGDTSGYDNVIKSVKDSDLLLHDSTFLDDINAEEYGHSTVSIAARIALDANVKRLGLIHISGRYENLCIFEEISRKIFEKSFVPKDLSYYLFR